MSVAVELLLTMCADAEEAENSVNPAGQNPDPDAPEVDDEQSSSIPRENDPTEQNDEEPNQNSNSDRVGTVGPQAINVAYSIVNACLSQLCEYKLLFSFLQIQH